MYGFDDYAIIALIGIIAFVVFVFLPAVFMKAWHVGLKSQEIEKEVKEYKEMEQSMKEQAEVKAGELQFEIYQATHVDDKENYVRVLNIDNENGTVTYKNQHSTQERTIEKFIFSGYFKEIYYQQDEDIKPTHVDISGKKHITVVMECGNHYVAMFKGIDDEWHTVVAAKDVFDRQFIQIAAIAPIENLTGYKQDFTTMKKAQIGMDGVKASSVVTGSLNGQPCEMKILSESIDGAGVKHIVVQFMRKDYSFNEGKSIQKSIDELGLSISAINANVGEFTSGIIAEIKDLTKEVPEGGVVSGFGGLYGEAVNSTASPPMPSPKDVSKSDDSGSVIRVKQNKMSGAKLVHLDEMKQKFLELEKYMDETYSYFISENKQKEAKRNIDLFKQHLEEACFHAVKAFTA